MGKCTNCGAALDPVWKFCIACGASVEAPNEPGDESLPRKRMDAALIFGIAVAVGGGVLIILVAIALFSPRG